jgi:hypothetical protein
LSAAIGKPKELLCANFFLLLMMTKLKKTTTTAKLCATKTTTKPKHDPLPFHRFSRQPAKRAGGFVFAENFKQWG